MKTYVILNPKSGNGCPKHLEEMLRKKLGSSLKGIEKTTYPGQATLMARQAVQEGADTIVAVGGDGTVNEVFNGMIGTGTKLGIIPNGTANDLASFYHIPEEAAEACDLVIHASSTTMDAICVNGWYYLTAGGIGFPCEVVSLAARMKGQGKLRKITKILGSRIYWVSALFVVGKGVERRQAVEIRWEDHSIHVDLLSLIVNNQPFLGKVFQVAPGAANDDGLFDVCLIPQRKSRREMLSLFAEVLTRHHLHSTSVKSWRTKEILIKAMEPLPFLGDGQIYERSAEFRIGIVPRALEVIVPRPWERGESR